MIIKYLELLNFRNYKSLALSFDKGINYIIGENAKGKTNLVESIYSLSFARSFRTSFFNEMIMLNEQFSEVKGEFVHENSKKTIDIRYQTNGKKVLINGKVIKKISELNNVVNILYFIPKDTNLLKDSPKIRRQFLNATISKINSSYLNDVINFEKLLKERNDAFKAYRMNFTLIDILTNQLIELSYKIFIERMKFIKSINKIINEVYKNVSLIENENLQIKYFPFLKNINKEEYIKEAKKRYKETLEEDLKKKVTTIGIQKEDFKIYLNSKDIGIFGSQGENKMSVLALKISPYFLSENEKEKPIIILDDVISELDLVHEENLLNYLKTFEQVFITNTRKSEFYKNKYYVVKNNDVTIEEEI